MKKVMFWNLRGIGTSKKRLRKLVRVHQPCVLFLAEPFGDDSQLSYWCDYFSFSACISNADKAGKLWCFWVAGIQVDVVGGSDQYLALMINSNILISTVYAKCWYLDRRVLWEDLLNVNAVQMPHVILGDFNILRNDSERRGGGPRLLMAMEEFSSIIDAGGLVEMPFIGNKFSWGNGQSGMARSWAHLDRAMCNLKFLEVFPMVHNQYLPRRSSDHSPMLLSLSAALSRVLSSPVVIHEDACVYFEEFLKATQSSSLPNLDDLILGEVSIGQTELPHLLKGIIRTDACGLPQIRKC
ncbi:hypothetical protein F2P56_015179 [Juglans regia]|uniref:Endonuclease/exonuclease/phosphatase domain-containing protein n=2 Tax=Juglans regia TaxID=51240 RepID=A0A833XEP9_JUGRE|nr:uncharacterized protein LOC108990822 [Juglans regia]KAF5465148.1 hypothetical protein F2P56_015179 [Juglans regia]